MIARHSRWWQVFLCGGLALILVACASTASFKEIQRENFYRGNMIVAAVQRYQSKYSHVPDTLAALVPEFLTEVPRTVSGEEFDYRAQDRFLYDDWSLSFIIKDYRAGCSYIGHFDLWDCAPPGAGDA